MTTQTRPAGPRAQARPAGRPLRLGSMCTGYGGLDMAVAAVLDVEPAWVADPDPGAAAILAHHWPTAPNLGDITRVDWTTVPPVDVIAAGFPCQPVSHAGRRAGANDERWLWDDVARAIAVLRPRLVVLENVRGLLSSPGRQPDCVCGWDHRWGGQLRHLIDHDERPDQVLADGRRADGQAPRPERAADGVGRSPGTGGSARPGPGLGRDVALGAVGVVAPVPAGGTASLPDGEEGPGGTAAADARPGLAGLGEWARHLLDAGDLGRVAEGQGPDTGTEPAGHRRDRRGDCPACGRPLDDAADRPVRRAVGDVLWSLSCLGFDARWLTLRASDVGAPHRRERWFLLAWPADADRPRLEGRRVRGAAPERGGAVPDADGAARGERWVAAPGQAEGGRAWADARGRSRAPAPYADGEHAGPVTTGDRPGEPDGRDEGRPEPAGIVRRPDAALRRDAAAHPESIGHRHAGTPSVGGVSAPAVASAAAWGAYAPAIDRWSRILGRPAPRPTEPGRTGERLSPAFVEWLMGLPAGHVTAVPGLTRNAQLKALGNGVVWQQGAAALALLLDRIGAAL